MRPAKLLLASGEEFSGYSPDWCRDITHGEVVFNTGMVGYVEAMTDPSYRNQILTFTYPLVGNYGVSLPETWESDKIQVSGIVMQEMAGYHSRENTHSSLIDWCREAGVPYIEGIDTRELTKTIRNQGVVSGAIVMEGASKPKTFPDINDAHLVADVSTDTIREYGTGDKTLICVDCGMKQNILRCLQKFNWKIKRVPHNYDYTNEAFDAVFVSNGPGDPARCVETIEILKKAMKLGKPMFGICLGSQIMGLAIGASTYKLTFGHRSQNQPCLELGTDKCLLTSENHGFAIDEKTLPNDWVVTHKNLNDNSVQGIKHKTKPYFSVQFHPEACPGPVDTEFFFKDFYELV